MLKTRYTKMIEFIENQLDFFQNGNLYKEKSRKLIILIIFIMKNYNKLDNDHFNEYFKEIRRKWDNTGNMNPDKLTHSNITYRRMNIMFTMNGILRRIQAIFRRAKRILEIPVHVREGY